MKKPDLLPYQKTGVKWLDKKNGRGLLADEMGLGKTIQSLYWTLTRKKVPLVVVCPASLKENWRDEIDKHFGVECEILKGENPPEDWLEQDHPDILIVNYRILSSWMDNLIEFDPTTVIIDECQEMKNFETLAFRMCDELCWEAPHVIPMTGTPISNRPKELWPILHILDPEEFPYFDSFGQDYCNPKMMPWGWTYNGSRNLKKLHKVLKKYMLRRLKEDKLKGLKTQRKVIVPVPLYDREEYDKAENDLIRWIDVNHGRTRAKRAEKAEKMVRFNYTRQLASELKMPAVEDWIRRFLKKSNRKMVVFGVHKKVIRQGLYKKFRRCSVIIDGETTPKKKAAAVYRFQNDPRCRLCFGNVKSAGSGLTLTAGSYTAVVELPWTPGDLGQLMARTHRIGQKQKTKVFFLIGEDTIEVEMANILDEKQRVFSQVVDGKSGEDEYSIVESLEQTLLEMED